MPGAISDSSTLIHLAAIGRFPLLRDFFDSVAISPAVWREVVLEGEDRVGAREVRIAVKEGWMTITEPGNPDRVHELLQELHPGEAESIALACETRGIILLLDETEARRIAEGFGIEVTGIIGILLLAKKQKKIRSMRAELGRLRKNGGFWISKSLYRLILEQSGEEER